MDLPKTKELKELCAKLGRKYVGFKGSPLAPIWLVGEAPGADEDQAGVPFVGYSGQELDRMLIASGISPSKCCYTNPYKVRPKDNDIDRIEETGIKKEQFEEQFIEELEQYKPPFIISLGGTATQILCPHTLDYKDKVTKISKWRGSILQSDRLLPRPHIIVPNFHPAYILREWSDRDTAVFIFQKFKEEFDFWCKTGKHKPLEERELISNPSQGEIEDYIRVCNASTFPTSRDIELIARRVPICISLSCNRNSAISISLFEGDPRNLARTWRLLAENLRTHRGIGQNWTTFDGNWMEALGLPSGVDSVDDTLVRHHVLHPELSHKLDFQVMQYTRLPYFKDEGKGWQLREGLQKLKRYNCLDACSTFEVWEEQEKEFAESPGLKAFYDSYEMPLARGFQSIDKRGILTDAAALSKLRTEILTELNQRIVEISGRLNGRPVVYSQQMAAQLAEQLKCSPEAILNISSVPQLKEVLKNDLKIKLKSVKNTKGEFRESTGEESLNEAFALTGNPVLKNVLRVRELTKVRGTYVDARLNSGVFHSCYSVTGTVTGRRASRQTFLGYGSNGQNQPKHSDLGEKFQGVFIARPDSIFAYCDQASAEEWIVQGIIADVSGDRKGIQELIRSIETGVSRHAILASQIFGLPIEKTNNKECLEYYIGKKVRHAGNYDMHADKMATVMASEGFPTKVSFCDAILTKFHTVEPNIKGVFHKYVEHELRNKRLLVTPLGRERTFHGLRPYGDNGKIFREGYAYIPQSTIGDNNGLAILYIHRQRPGIVLADGHDSMLCECKDTFEDVLRTINLMRSAYDRILKFPVSGFEVKIPIDFKIGYSIQGLKKCPADLNETGLSNIYNMLRTQQKAQPSSTGGPLPSPSQQPSSETSGSTVNCGSSTQTST